ncbi:hypothetical protein H671_xg20405 [Cricetulus griseus]|uniref:Uncharacterized protein n=1 Tax=Cricetulus griseus TaxID=10029 RepID=A0A061HUH0_CRIGR|nr:hypothetical protein H671_xg20405 [Cricetulus griseus]
MKKPGVILTVSTLWELRISPSTAYPGLDPIARHSSLTTTGLQRLAQCLAVGVCFCFHQILDESSRMVCTTTLYCKDVFGVVENIQIVYDLSNLSNKEECDLPIHDSYTKLLVRVTYILLSLPPYFLPG